MNATAKTSEVRLILPALADYLDTVRLVLYGMAVRAGYSYEAIEDLKVAVTEACTYIILQQENAGGEGWLRLDFRLLPEALEVSAQGGPGFRFAPAVEAAEPMSGSEIQDASPERLGLYLMQALVDEVRLTEGEEAGSEAIVLVKRKT
ncbi:ATP-binding protein [Paenibacillus filicis]|uniref:ATP-binding protein n=1 Tax=Paenibacillus gyeongsangnamensis TaxID=3388067 RepID=A0ABT4QHN7_9BACL|nr:ATP-binding protein [Paenibacillus filicis]MCZ8516220.1 ATP-binding protein [Paenibacillus filicis]